MRNIPRPFGFIVACLLALTVPLACGGDDNGGVGVEEERGDVAGTAALQDGTPVPGTSLSLQRSGQSTLTRQSGSDGTFRFADVLAGQWTLNISAPAGFELASSQSASVNVSVQDDQTTTTNVTLAAVAGVETGQVRVSVEADGSPRSGVDADLFASGSSSSLQNVTTGTDGTATFGAVETGNYEVEITVPSGFELAAGESSRKDVTVQADAITDVDFELQEQQSGGVVVVDLVNFAFQSDDVTIDAGTTIRWRNTTNMNHTVTPDGHSEWSEHNFPTGSNGETFEHTFNSPGTFPYICVPHFSQYGMAGTITVE